MKKDGGVAAPLSHAFDQVRDWLHTVDEHRLAVLDSLKIDRWISENSSIDEWVYFFKNSEVRPDFRSKSIQAAAKKLDLLNMSEQERQAYEKYLVNRASEKDMIESAYDEGIEKGCD